MVAEILDDFHKSSDANLQIGIYMVQCNKAEVYCCGTYCKRLTAILLMFFIGIEFTNLTFWIRSRMVFFRF